MKLDQDGERGVFKKKQEIKVISFGWQKEKIGLGHKYLEEKTM